MTNTKNKNSCAMTAVVTLFMNIFLVVNLSYADCRPDILLLFFFNGALFYAFTLRALFKHPYSLELMFWIFMFYFMFFAPLVQYTRHDFPWGRLNDTAVWSANVILFLFSLSFIIGTSLYKAKKREIKRNDGFFISEPIESSTSFSAVLLMISGFIFLLALRRKGVSGLFVGRNENVGLYEGTNSSISMLVTSISIAFLTFATAYAFSLAKKQRGLQRYVLPFLQFACLLLSYFPTSIARYSVACIYIGLILIVVNRFERGSSFYWFFTVALVFLFPLMNLFRYQNLFEADISKFLAEFSKRFFSSYTDGHYDAFAMLGQTVQYVKRNGFSYGYQLLGSVLFFVPRTFWPNKPIGSGATIMETLRKDFTNVSCPLMGEAYINFGYAGVIVFALLVGYWVSRLDTSYWQAQEECENCGSVYLFLLSLFFFMLRGDLLSSWAYTMGFVAVAFVLRVAYRHFDISNLRSE